MKREILDFEFKKYIDDCCPNHSTWPSETYNSRRSEHAHSRDKKREHRFVRHVAKQKIQYEVDEIGEEEQN